MFGDVGEFDFEGLDPERILRAILPPNPREEPILFMVSMVTTGEVRLLGNAAATKSQIAHELDRISAQLKAQVAMNQ